MLELRTPRKLYKPENACANFYARMGKFSSQPQQTAQSAARNQQLHAQTEEELLYPAALMIGDYFRLRR
jgi:hypothetical protein